jgi:hypothetical protein
MHSRWYTSFVVVFWLLTMSWLVAWKILPPLLVGEPPSFQAMVAAQKRELPVGWDIFINDRRLGWALTRSVPQPGGETELRGHLHFDRIPVAEMTPGWLHTLLNLVEQPRVAITLDTRSTATITAQGRLSQFQSVVRIDPLEDAIRLAGRVEKNRLTLTVTTADFRYQTETYLPPDALLGDALSPQTQMPGLHLGQKWTVPIYSLLRPANSPLEILQAMVEDEVPIYWEHDQDVWLVVYRSDPGFSFSRGPPPRGRLWVCHDGTVLKQEVAVLDSQLIFVRMNAQRAAVVERTEQAK